MAVLPFRWQGAARVELIRSRMAASAAQSLRGWTASTIECELRPERSDADFGEWYALDGDAGRAILAMPHGAFSRLGCGLVGLAEPDDLGLAAGVGRRAALDLLQSMTGLASPRGLTAMDAPQAAALQARHGIASFLWEIMGLRLAIYLDARLCEALAPSHPAPGVKLHRREEVVMPEQVALRAVLDLGHAALEDTLNLKPGDVIRTGARLDAKVRLKADEAGISLEGALSAAGDRRAFRFLSVSQT